MDRIAEMLENVARPEDTDHANAKLPAFVKFGGDPPAVQVDRLATWGRMDPAAQVNLQQAVEV